MLLMLVELFSFAAEWSLRGDRLSVRVGELRFELRRESERRVEVLMFEWLCKFRLITSES